MASKLAWEDALPLSILAIRTTYRDDLNCSPAELVFGTELAIPGDMVTPNAFTGETPNETVNPLRSAMKQIRSTPTRVDHGVTEYIPKLLASATHVWLRKHNRSSLIPPYTGPYKIVELKARTLIIATADGNREVGIQDIKPARVEKSVRFNIPRGRGRPKN